VAWGPEVEKHCYFFWGDTGTPGIFTLTAPKWLRLVEVEGLPVVATKGEVCGGRCPVDDAAQLFAVWIDDPKPTLSTAINTRADRPSTYVARNHRAGGNVEPHASRMGELLLGRHRHSGVSGARQLRGCAVAPVVALQAQDQTKQGRQLSTPAPLRDLRARASDPAWARRAVGEGVGSCPSLPPPRHFPTLPTQEDLQNVIEYILIEWFG
jgi:hypothetical protein